MSRRLARLLSAALAATSVAALGTSANAAGFVRPTIHIPTIRPVIPTVRHVPTLPSMHVLPRPQGETRVSTLPATHAPTLPATHAPTQPATHAPTQNVATSHPVPSQPAPHSSGQKITFTPVSYPEITNAFGSPIGYVNAQGQAVYFPNGHLPVGFGVGPNHTIQTYISSVSTPTPAPTPASHPAPAPAPAPQHPSSSNPAPSSGHIVTFTPVSYPEITNAFGSPIGYVNAQGQAVYFPNGHLPAGFGVGPNHTIQTYISSNTTPAPTSTPTPAPTSTPASHPAPAPQQASPSHPAPAPQPPAPSKPAATPAPHHQVTFTPVSYPEITNAYGSPIGYVDAHGQAVYFPNGHLPAGFGVGPNHTITTYIKSQT